MTTVPFFEWIGRHLAVIVPVLIMMVGSFLVAAKAYRDSFILLIAAHKESMETKLEKAKVFSMEARSDILKHADLEVAKIWAEIRTLVAMQSTQISEIAVLRVEHKNTRSRLDEIRDMVGGTNGKIDQLLVEMVHTANRRKGLE